MYPGNAEICDTYDNNCNGQVDENATTTYYFDDDGDTHGDPNITAVGCTIPENYVLSSDDCDDTDATVYSGAIELCDGQDNDCSGSIPADETDDDSDTYVECTIDG